MEPALGERDDDQKTAPPRSWVIEPQWSPLLVSGMTRISSVIAESLVVPQWSPLLVSGMTLLTTAAAMQASGPQWSPLLVSGMTAREKRAC